VQEDRHLASHDAARAELQGVLSSACFQRSPRLSALLSYLCAKALAGEAEQLKEYTIGVEVLGRPESFDPTEDAGARVEIHRLRKRLADFYKDEGAAHSVQIEIPSGQYAPRFIQVDFQKPPEATPGQEAPEPLAPEVRASSSLWKYWPIAAAVAGVVTLIPLFASLRKPPQPSPAVPETATVTHPENIIRVACGRSKPYVDHWGQRWERDIYAEGGTPYDNSKPVIGRAFDPRLFAAGRSGDFTYKIPAPPGRYELHLLFAETEFGTGNPRGAGEAARWFDVTVNDRKVLERFDVLSDAGGANIATARVFKDISPGPDGLIRISFRGERDKPIVSGIELVPQQRKGHLNPVRIVAKNNFYTSPDGQVWTPDNYVDGGQASIHTGPVSGTKDDELFTNERYGHFSYAIPVDEGTYAVTLYMAERYYGPGGAKEGGAGTRLFDVDCNGQTLLRNFDLLTEAGRERAVIKTFRGLSPNGQGKLLLTFSPRRDYASIYAIEVLDESK
jgi:hypothetical protein